MHYDSIQVHVVATVMCDNATACYCIINAIGICLHASFVNMHAVNINKCTCQHLRMMHCTNCV
jgi:hypothetical protein